MKTIRILTIVMISSLASCFLRESDESKIARAEKDCSQKTEVESLRISFYGYFPIEADSIEVKIKRNQEIVECFSDKIPEIIDDSLRHLRHYSLNKKIMLTDTLFLKIKSEPEKKIYDFKYLVRPHFTMLSSGWGCDFYKLTVDGKTEEGAIIRFMKKDWDIIERKSFKDYYYKK